ncbi:anthrone oxygenase family protein [Kitasatospora aburaviensis]
MRRGRATGPPGHHHAGGDGRVGGQLPYPGHPDTRHGRALAGTAGLLTVTSFLVTRFGNVPINGRIKQWAVTAPPADHAEILHRWQLFNNVRTLSGVLAFAVLIYVALRRKAWTAGQEAPGPAMNARVADRRAAAVQPPCGNCRTNRSCSAGVVQPRVVAALVRRQIGGAQLTGALADGADPPRAAFRASAPPV